MKTTLALRLTLALATSAFAQHLPVEEEYVKSPKKEYSPYVEDHFPNRVFFGDTHHHTILSFDGGLMGTKLGPEDSFRFALGKEVVSNTGIRVRLIRPLDFLVVTDHAEYLGLADLIRTSDPELLATQQGKRWYNMFQKGGNEGFKAAAEVFFSIGKRQELIKSDKLKRSVWERVTGIASEYNEPGKFTAFNGYEWTSTPGGNNLHRVVIFRDGPDRVNQIVPFSAFDSNNPEDLWKFMASYEKNTGGQVLAIPHNGNASNGRMFEEQTFLGGAVTRAYAIERMRHDPLFEVTQTKGDSETHPFLSTDDEFAEFERWDFGNFGNPTVPKKTDMLQFEYARSALKLGLKQEAKLGANPFKFGMIGGTDTHIGLSTTREANFFGKMPQNEPSPERWEHVMLKKADGSAAVTDWMLGASGLAAVWARENTRESLFDAMARKEVYATTGSRILVRVFAGWDFVPAEVQRPDFAEQGYRRGVAMGGDLRKAPAGKSPTFMVRALRDVDGANLDRVQIIKGWLDKRRKLHEKLYDVALSDGRKPDANGKVRHVGNTVDVKNASFTNTIGDSLLTAHWVDPDFDPTQRAFYYVRVIELPKPRWTAYDAKFFKVKMPKHVPMVVQDRAYTSPIWYTP